jgi:hypothetical protein
MVVRIDGMEFARQSVESGVSRIHTLISPLNGVTDRVRYASTEIEVAYFAVGCWSFVIVVALTALGGRITPPWHAAAHCSLRDIESKFQQFARIRGAPRLDLV